MMPFTLPMAPGPMEVKIQINNHLTSMIIITVSPIGRVPLHCHAYKKCLLTGTESNGEMVREEREEQRDSVL
jgi:hypothetical protein